MTSSAGAWAPNALQELALASALVATAMLTFGLLAELAGVLMIDRRFRYVVIPPLIAMHVGTSVVVNIDFPVYLLQLLLLGFPWPALYERLAVPRPSPSPPGAS